MSGPSLVTCRAVPLVPTLPLIAILPPPKPPCTSMLPGKPRIQPSNEPTVPGELERRRLRCAELASICSGWLGAVDLKRAARHLEHHRRPAGALGHGQRPSSRTSIVPIHGNAGFVRSAQRAVLAGMRARAVGRRQHLEVGVAHLVALDQDVGAFQHDPADLDLAEEQREGIEIHREAADAGQLRARCPRGIGERHAFGHQRRLAPELHRQRHARGSSRPVALRTCSVRRAW